MIYKEDRFSSTSRNLGQIWINSVTFVSYFNVKQSKIDNILVCKILTDGAMDLYLGNVVHLITLHLHTKFVAHLFLKIYPLKSFFYEKKKKNSHHSGL